MKYSEEVLEQYRNSGAYWKHLCMETKQGQQERARWLTRAQLKAELTKEK